LGKAPERLVHADDPGKMIIPVIGVSLERTTEDMDESAVGMRLGM
jgi:hypothetical protein